MRWAKRAYWLGCLCALFLGGYPMYFLSVEGTGGALFGMALLVFVVGMGLTFLGLLAKLIPVIAKYWRFIRFPQ